MEQQILNSDLTNKLCLDNTSTFRDWENYDDICSTYTKQRQFVGFDEMIDFFKPTNNMSLLDAGCGTGNYTCRMINHFGYIHAGDFNTGMLRIAKAQTQSKQLNTPVNFSQLNICDMQEIADESFDCVINCQVIHHLPKTTDQNQTPFNAVKQACSEWYRILKPGGKLVINFVTHEQQMEGVWWGELIQDAVKRWQDNAPDKSDIQTALISAGFDETDITFEPILPKYDGKRCIMNAILYDESLYSNPENFLDIDTFRRCDSTFALAKDNELVRGVHRVQEMVNNGTLENWYQEKEEIRKRIGMTTNAYVIKRV